MEGPANRVRLERLRRGWSVRDAARASGISNTYWGAFEDFRQPLTPTIADAVARAFGWDTGWADRLVDGLEPVALAPEPEPDVAEAIAKLSAEFAAAEAGRAAEIEALRAEFAAERDAMLAAVRAATGSGDVELADRVDEADDPVKRRPRRN